jgi:DNA polymerase III subunit delta'
VHAYLFVGPRGSGKRAAARAFAAELLAATAAPAERDRVRLLAAAGRHADLVEIEPDGTIFRFPASRDGDSPGLRLVREASTSPRESDRKVVVAVDFHTARDEAVGKLLKVIEEPPASTVMVLLEEDVPPEQVTIASRCARVEFGPVPEAAVRAHLVDAHGLDDDTATFVAAVSGGDLGRARLLASDPGVRARAETWRSVPSRLDGHGATVVDVVAELRTMLDEAQAHLEAAQSRELADLDGDAEAMGAKRAPGRKDTTDRHKRALRRARTDELRYGLATLAGPYRERLASTDRPAEVVAALQAVQAAAEALERNPIEELLLESLLLRLPSPGP